MEATRQWRDGLAAGLGLLMVSGVYVDGWAHLNRPGLETFFTPWHAILYGGFTLLALFIAGTVLRRTPGRAGSRFAPPPGYGLAALGVVVFLAGGTADMVWHEVFGVEVAVDALVSPTHLVLLLGGMLMVTAPARAVGAGRSTADLVAVALSVAATASLAGFFLSYLSVFSDPGATVALTALPEGDPGHRAAELPAIVGLGSYLATTAAVLVPILALRRFRADVPPGAATAAVAAVALLGSMLTEFRYVVPAAGAVAGALLVDLSRPAWPARVDPWLALGVALPALMWAGQLVGLATVAEVAWAITMWAGVVLLCVLAGTALSMLTGRRFATPAPVQDRRRVVQPAGG